MTESGILERRILLREALEQKEHNQVITMEKDEDKVLVHCKLTRAERLTKIQLKESKIDENAKGLVVIEFNLSKQDLRKEYDEIMQASKQSGEARLQKVYPIYERNIKLCFKQKPPKIRLR